MGSQPVSGSNLGPGMGQYSGSGDSSEMARRNAMLEAQIRQMGAVPVGGGKGGRSASPRRGGGRSSSPSGRTLEVSFYIHTTVFL